MRGNDEGPGYRFAHPGYTCGASLYELLTAGCQGMAVGVVCTTPLRTSDIGPLPARASGELPVSMKVLLWSRNSHPSSIVSLPTMPNSSSHAPAMVGSPVSAMALV